MGVSCRALGPTRTIRAPTGYKPRMTSNCRDDLCVRKMRDFDRAIGRERSQWNVLLRFTKSHEDVENALRFCEVFRLEAKVKVSSEGYAVMVRDDLIRML